MSGISLTFTRLGVPPCYPSPRNPPNVFRLPPPSPVSFLLSPYFHLHFSFSHLSSPISNVSPLPSTVSHLQYPWFLVTCAVSRLTSPISCFPSPVAHLQSPISSTHLQSPIFSLLSPISSLHLLSSFYLLLSPVSCLCLPSLFSLIHFTFFLLPSPTHVSHLSSP